MGIKREMVHLLVIITILFVAVPAYAVDLMATGYDYVLMNYDQKTELVSTLYKVLQRDMKDPENTVVALDGLYYMYSHEIEDDSKIKDKQHAIEAVFRKPVMEIMAELMTMKPPMSYDEDMLKKYGLTLKK